MSGIIFLIVLGIHLSFGFFALSHFISGIMAAGSARRTLCFGVFTAVVFCISLSAWYYFFGLFYRANRMDGFALLASVGMGIPFFTFAAAFFIGPLAFKGRSEFFYKSLKAGIGLALPASTLFF
jgi:hypothetical protein